MAKSKRLQEIIRKNAEFEKEAPYNFCDRWCERCPLETQKRCRLYLEEFERRITNIAHGRDEDDLEILKEDLENKLDELKSNTEQWQEEGYFDFPEFSSNDYDENDNYEEIKKKEEQLQQHPLQVTAENYMHIIHNFLKEAFYPKVESMTQDLRSDYEVVAWYHTLLPVKLHLALCDLYARDRFAEENDIGLCDAVAQLAICKKAIKNSHQALNNIAQKNTQFKIRIKYFLSLLGNMFSRVELIEQEI